MLVSDRTSFSYTKRENMHRFDAVNFLKHSAAFMPRKHFAPFPAGGACSKVMRANNARVYAPCDHQKLPHSIAGISFGRFATGADASEHSIADDSVFESRKTPSSSEVRFLLCPCSTGFSVSSMICVVDARGSRLNGSAPSSRPGQSSRSIAVSKTRRTAA